MDLRNGPPSDPTQQALHDLGMHLDTLQARLDEMGRALPTAYEALGLVAERERVTRMRADRFIQRASTTATMLFMRACVAATEHRLPDVLVQLGLAGAQGALGVVPSERLARGLDQRLVALRHQLEVVRPVVTAARAGGVTGIPGLAEWEFQPLRQAMVDVLDASIVFQLRLRDLGTAGAAGSRAATETYALRVGRVMRVIQQVHQALRALQRSRRPEGPTQAGGERPGPGRARRRAPGD